MRPTPLELRVATANYAARRIREAMHTKDLPPAPHGWGIPIGRRNGGRPSLRSIPPPSTYIRPLDVVWITGVYPASMTRKSEINLKEL